MKMWPSSLCVQGWSVLSCLCRLVMSLIIEFQGIYPRLRGSWRISPQIIAILGHLVMMGLTNPVINLCLVEKVVW